MQALHAADRHLEARGDPRRRRVEPIAPACGPVAADEAISLQPVAALMRRAFARRFPLSPRAGRKRFAAARAG